MSKLPDDVFNENVSIENLEEISLGDDETGEGGTNYEEIVELMGNPPNNRAEYQENGSTIVEADWRRDNEGNEFISVNFIDGMAVGKFQEGLK
ncbi:hypothetical protein [Oceanobacillus massiliensis]|uniref:hypothetical protein n=1 Tax=Oceanobacillus massiliensis TaxID=1465765 RepID=UPI00031DD15A|nr:hypothetical protein [Oceanobacillus massiliensis]